LGIRDRCRRTDELRAAAIERADTSQPPKEIRDVASKYTAIRVQFVDDDELKIFEQLRPFRMVRQDAFVKHVRITQDDVPSRTDGGACVLRRVAVVRVDADFSLQ